MERIKTNLIEEKDREVVFEMLGLLRAHSGETYVHSVDVANKSLSMAIALGVKIDELKKLYTAGLLHDIGKLLVDKSLLHKKDATNCCILIC